MTLENGRRDLFWGKDRAVLDEWAGEDQPVACQLPATVDPNLFNTGLSRETTVAPDDLIEGGPIRIRPLSRSRWNVNHPGDELIPPSRDRTCYEPHRADRVASFAD